MSRAIENSKKQSYFIKSKKTKKGNTTYYMTKKEDETCLDEVPVGYEVFEKYDSGVLFIRKKQKSMFDLKEINCIKTNLNKNDALIDYRLSINGKEMAIYIAEKERNNRLLGSLMEPFFTKTQIDHFKSIRKTFEESMRIIIHENKSEKEFEVQRYCYRGSVDDWITVGVESDIKKIRDGYLIHLGRDSYFELWRY